MQKKKAAYLFFLAAAWDINQLNTDVMPWSANNVKCDRNFIKNALRDEIPCRDLWKILNKVLEIWKGMVSDDVLSDFQVLVEGCSSWTLFFQLFQLLDLSSLFSASGPKFVSLFSYLVQEQLDISYLIPASRPKKSSGDTDWHPAKEHLWTVFCTSMFNVSRSFSNNADGGQLRGHFSRFCHFSFFSPRAYRSRQSRSLDYV